VKTSGRKRAGFTLVEVMAVVLILALMMTAVSANFGRYLPAARCEQAARALLNHMDLARTSAIAHGREYLIEIDLDANRFRTLTPWTTEGRPATLPEDRSSLGWEPLAEGVRFLGAVDSRGNRQEKGLYQVPFSPRGDGEDLFFHLASGDLEIYDVTVRLAGISGLAEVLAGQVLPTPVTEADFD
jgi:type II secretion system protein H